MSTQNPNSSSPQNGPLDDDRITIVYVEGPADTTVKPISPARRKLYESERELNAQWLEYFKQEQAKLDAAAKNKRKETSN